jgi:hypothetical protein
VNALGIFSEGEMPSEIPVQDDESLKKNLMIHIEGDDILNDELTQDHHI